MFEVNNSINGLSSSMDVGQESITALKNQVEELFQEGSGKGKHENTEVNRPRVYNYSIYILRIQEEGENGGRKYLQI